MNVDLIAPVLIPAAQSLNVEHVIGMSTANQIPTEHITLAKMLF
jgi:hypothetical protein